MKKIKDGDFLNSLKILLERNNQKVTDIEMTSGNYDDNGNLIAEEIPTLTTEFCEIGTYYERVCYFTVILYSDSFSKGFFESIRNLEGIHIYGFRNFLEDYYPNEKFNLETLRRKIKQEKYFQIQFNFDREKSSPEAIFKRHIELKTLFGKTSARVVNQITQNLIDSV